MDKEKIMKSRQSTNVEIWEKQYVPRKWLRHEDATSSRVRGVSLQDYIDELEKAPYLKKK